jgi:hypothetical protein
VNKLFKSALVFALMLVGASFIAVDGVGALSLRVQPLSFQETLTKGEKKKGFIDITNPTALTIRLETSVEAFRQTDDQGGLQFYNNEQISAGIIPDLKEFTLKAGETMRLMFLVDGSKLPQGDVFAALTATNTPDQKGNMAQAVRVGTLLILTNGTPGARQAAVTSLNAPLFQFGDTITGKYRVKNTAPANTAAGFYPEVSLSLSPFGTTKKQKSTLVFAGRERENQFEIPSNRVGIYKLTVGYGNSQQSRWVIVASPLWIGIILLLIVALAVVLSVIRRHRRSMRFVRRP